MNPAEHPIVAIRWLDSHSPGPVWTTIDELDDAWAAGLTCITIGMLVRETTDAVTVATSVTLAKSPQAQGVICIPRGAIIAMKVMGNPFAEGNETAANVASDENRVILP